MELCAATSIAAFVPRARAESVGPALITVWLEGGPSQHDTFDPKPGGPTSAIKTAIPGVDIAATLPSLAAVLDRFSLIRSLVSPEADHERATYFMKSGHRMIPGLRHPSLGGMLAELPRSPLLPAHVSLCPSQWPAWGGFLGEASDAMRVKDAGSPLANLGRGDDLTRRQRRERLRLALDPTRLAETEHLTLERRALALSEGDAAKAFELKDEPAAIVRAYGDTSFGRGCLVARRLVEAGVRAVEVTLQGFDAHAGCAEAHAKNAAILDPALAALVADLDARQLWRSTILVVAGEFGRTPRLNALEGRDHWPHGFSALIGGAGLRSGVVLGETDPRGEVQEPKDPIPAVDLLATVLSAAGLDPSEVIVEPGGRPIARSDGSPIGRLLA
ncbi:MAG: DUF1501 domain-containing protein [Myxococcota bacterium]